MQMRTPKERTPRHSPARPQTDASRSQQNPAVPKGTSPRDSFELARCGGTPVKGSLSAGPERSFPLFSKRISSLWRGPNSRPEQWWRLDSFTGSRLSGRNRDGRTDRDEYGVAFLARWKDFNAVLRDWPSGSPQTIRFRRIV